MNETVRGNFTCLPTRFILHVRAQSFLGMYVFAAPSLKHREKIGIFFPHARYFERDSKSNSQSYVASS